MLSRDKADQIADELLSQARTARRAGGRTPHIGIVYRCPEVAALDPWQQAAVVRQASAARGKPLVYCALAWGALGVSCLTYLAVVKSRYSFPILGWFLYFAGLAAIKVFFMRKKIAKIGIHLRASIEASGAQG